MIQFLMYMYSVVNMSNLFLCTVSGDANFAMHHTGLTIGGFTQPSVARSLIEIPSNVEKGLCQRFLWVVPKPASVGFNELEKVDTDFTISIGKFSSIIFQCDTNVFQ